MTPDKRIKYEAFRILAAIVPRLPEHVAHAAAAAIATLAFRVTPRRRFSVLANLTHVLPPGSSAFTSERVACDIYRSVARYYVDLLRTPFLDTSQLRRSEVREEGYAYLREALAEGRGAIIATIHYGCPEVALQAARAWGLTFFVLLEPLAPAELSDLFLRLRASHGHRFMTAGRSALKEALRTIRHGGVVLLAVDRDIQGHGSPVKFFDAVASMPTGAIELARLTGAPIIPAVSRRLPDGSAVVRLQEPLDLVDSKERRADVLANTTRLIQRFEPIIREEPGQWLVLDRLWESGSTANGQ